MTTDLKAWQRSAIRNTMANYRRSQEDYFLAGKPLAEWGDGQKAFSLLTPPLGSPASRRRIRLIMDDMLAPPERRSRTPHVVTIAVSYNCQCDCMHRSAADYRDNLARDRQHLSFLELQGAVEQAIDLGATCTIFTGGEPLLFEKIFGLIESVDKSRSVCTMFTNGEFLREHAVKKLKQAGLFGVYVSLDHAEPGLHDRNRQRPGLFAKAVRGLELCREAGLLTGISTYATREKMRNGELDAMMDLASRMQALEVFLFDVIPTGRLSGQNECLLSDGEAEAIREFRNMYSTKPDYPRVVHQTMFARMVYPCVAEGCPAGMVHLHIRANGDVSPCDFTPHSFGNIRQQPLREIWQTMIQSDLYAQPSARCRLSDLNYWARLDELKAAATEPV